MIARVTPYRAPPEAVASLIDEVVAVARARRSWPLRHPNRRAEFFFVNTTSGDSLSLVLGLDHTVARVVDLERRPSEDPEAFDVRLLQVGGPGGSGVVDALFGRVVRCDRDDARELSFNGDAVPKSPDVWARALLVSRARDVLAFAVATDRAALEESLHMFSARCTRIDDYDEVAYHFFAHYP